MLCLLALFEFCAKNLQGAVNKYAIRKTLLGLVITINAFLFGADIAFCTTLLPRFENSNASTILKTSEYGRWLTPLSTLSAMPATIIGAIFSEIIGRKWLLTLGAFGNGVGWCISATSSQLWQFFLGRTIHGFQNGLILSTTYTFIVEVIHDNRKQRRVFFNLINIGIALGILFVDVAGTSHYIRTSSTTLVVLSAVNFFILLYLKNSHVWYLQRRRTDDAILSYFWYKAESHDEIKNFTAILENYKTEDVPYYKQTRLKSELTKKEFVKPFLLMILFALILSCTGGFVTIAYAVGIMDILVSIDPYLMTILIDSLRVVAALGMIPILGQSKRKIITINAILSTCFFLVIMSSQVYENFWEGLRIVRIAAILFLTVVYNMGVNNMLFICLGDAFQDLDVNAGCAIVSCFLFLFTFASLRIIPTLFIRFGIVVSFCVFAICLMAGSFGLFVGMRKKHDETQSQRNEII